MRIPLKSQKKKADTSKVFFLNFKRVAVLEVTKVSHYACYNIKGKVTAEVKVYWVKKKRIRKVHCGIRF